MQTYLVGSSTTASREGRRSDDHSKRPSYATKQTRALPTGSQINGHFFARTANSDAVVVLFISERTSVVIPGGRLRTANLGASAQPNRVAEIASRNERRSISEPYLIVLNGTVGVGPRFNQERPDAWTDNEVSENDHRATARISASSPSTCSTLDGRSLRPLRSSRQ